MSLTDLEITGYRSIRSIRFPLKRLTVLVGGNGVG
jgi:predicted ATPase